LPILAVSGEGCALIDDKGKRYLDFFGGLAVNALGYAHPEITNILRIEAGAPLHVSNLIFHPYQAPLAKKLAQHAGLDRVFFGNTARRRSKARSSWRAYARSSIPRSRLKV
jgi:acetylornithine/succinyldiaminopimelate/putrescine aminotransferase